MNRTSQSFLRNRLWQHLEPRVLFDAAPEAEVTTVDDTAAQDSEPEVAIVAASDETTSASVEELDQEATRELVIVDASVENYQSLVADLLGNQDESRTFEVIVIEADEDGIARLTEVLGQRDNLDALHLVSHGEEGAFKLGHTWINDHSLTANAGAISAWGDAIKDSGDILLYGCDVAGNATGQELVESLAALTQQQVAASDDGTGSANQDGDWHLEYHVGNVDTDVAVSESFQNSYAEVLAAGPGVSFATGASNVPIGEDFTFIVEYQNTGLDVGYGPFIDLLMPTSGEDGDDGITFNGATYLGTSVNATQMTFGDLGGGYGIVSHPYNVQPVNETQAIVINGDVTGGTFTLTYNGQTTSDLAYDADAATIASELAALSSLSGSNISVTGSLANGHVLVEFIGSLSRTDVSQISVDNTNIVATTTGIVDSLNVNQGSATAVPVNLFGRTGDVLVVLELPFGSFSPGQPAAAIAVSASVSDLADLSTPMTVQARSGFRFGEDPIDNPDADAVLVDDNGIDVTGESPSTQWSDTMDVTPTLMSVSKTYSGPESETATGESFSRTYSIVVDVADGQTVSNLDIIDMLPNNIVVTSVDSVTVGGSPATYSDNLASLTQPGNNQELVVTLTDAVVGGTTSSDVVVTISFYVAEFDANGDRVIPINGEDDTTSSPDSRSHNNVKAVGDWNPIDGRDSGGTDNAVSDPVGDEHVLDDKAIAIQKSAVIITDTGTAGATPGDTIEYTLNFQISDYFTFGDLLVTDTFQDGQRFDFSSPVTFSITDMNGTVTNTFTVRQSTDPDGGETLVVDETQIDRTDDDPDSIPGNADDEDGVTPDGSDGSTTLTFDLSQALIDNGAADGILQGGLTNGAVNGGAAYGQIKFRTVIQEDYSDTFASNDRSVDQGDVITNTSLAISGTVRENAEDDDLGDGFATLQRVLGSESDESSASITLIGGTLEKTVYAVNGSTTLPTGSNGKVILVAGDVVTYRINYTLPSSDFEDLRITDFLPLPIFDVTDHDADGVDNAGGTYGWTFNVGGSFDSTAPASGVIEFGDNDSFYNSNPTSSNIVPTISVDAGANSISLNFGDYDDPSSMPSNIELFVSVTASDLPTADGLFLTNQVRVEEGTTQVSPNVIDRIVQVEMTQPILNITKGIVATDQGDSSFDAPTGPVTFAGVGSLGSPFSGTLNSNGLDATNVDANVSNLEAGDRVRFAIVIENEGSSYRGAHDVTIQDLLPPGMSFVAGTLQVVDGTGASHTFTDANAGNPGLFGDGIIIDDPGPTPDSSGADAGSIDGSDATSGRNILVVVYDAEVLDTATINSTLTNTAEIVHYASKEGGQNHAAGLIDTAEADLRNFSGTKTIVGTSESHTAENGGTEEVTIGEIIRYRVEVEIPQGSLLGMSIFDVLPSGLTYLDDGTATVAFVSDTGITSSTLTDVSIQTTNPSFTPTFSLPDDATSRNNSTHDDNYATGTDVYFKLGDITNSDNDANAEYVIVEFNVLVDNNSTSAQNDTSDTRRNDFSVYSGTQIQYDLPQGDRPVVRIVEPLISDPNVAADVSTGDAGDTINYTIDFAVATGSNRADAFNVVLTNDLAAKTTFGSFTSITVGGVVVTSGDAAYPTINQVGNQITFDFGDLDEGTDVEIQYSVTVDGTVTPDEDLVNQASVTWTSLSGNFGTDDGTGGNNTGSDLTSLNGLSTGGSGESASTTYATSSGALSGMRDGSTPSGQPNDYFADDASPASFNVDVTWDIDKTLISSEIDDSYNGLTDVVVGELVVYEIVVSLPEASTPSSVITDQLDAGLSFVRMISQTDSGITSEFTPTPTVSTDGSLITWNYGDIVDSDTSDGNGGTITLRYEAVVTNVSTNQASSSLDNVATYTWGGSATNNVTDDAVDVVVREPAISLSQTISIDGNVGQTNGDAGDAVAYSIVLQNSSGYDAFDLGFLDVIPKNGTASALNGVNFTVTDSLGTITASDFTLSGDDATGYSLQLNGGVDLDMLASQASRTITIGITGTIPSTVSPNASFSNAPQVTWTSLDGDISDRSTHNAASDERDGTNASDDTHDYVGGDAITFMVNPPGLVKSLVSTNQTETTGTDVTIGEQVTYAMLVTLPEGNTPGLSVVDLLPTGLIYTSHSIVTTAASSGGLLTNDFNGTLPAESQTGGSTDGEDVTLTFGGITVVNDNVDNNNSFVVFITATVTDNAANVGYGVGQTTLSNGASIDVTGDAVGPLASNTVDVDVVESNLQITKAIDLDNVNARDTITVTLTVTNSGEGNAYDVVIRDILDSAIYDVSTVALGSSGTEYPADFAAVNSSGTVTYSGGTIAAGASVTMTFTVNIHDNVVLGQDVTNTATITDASTLAGTETGERTETDADGDNSDVDTDTFHVRENTIAGNVYFDADNDGVFDGLETGIDGVLVTLTGTDHLGRSVSRTFTTGTGGQATGGYLFADLHPGTYTVTETTVPTLAANGKTYLDGLDTAGSAGGVTTINDQISAISLVTSAETDSTGNNFGELEEVELSGLVWHDANNDATKQAGEVGIDGVTVTLSGTDDQGAITNVVTTTSGGGLFSFDNLRPGEYTITQTQPTFTAPSGRDYADGKDRDGSLGTGDASSNDTITSINVTAGQTGTDYRFGELVDSVVSGYVYNDVNNDGIRSGESGIDGIQIRLTGTDDLGNAVNRTETTASGGFYQFANLRPSNAAGYTITQVAQPSGYLDGTDAVGTQGGTLANDALSQIVITSDTSGTENNFGELRPSTLEGYVYNDLDNDGNREAGEHGIQGVRVTLTGTDDRGNTINTFVDTDVSGQYRFTNLRPSDGSGYTLTETQPADWTDGIHSDGSLANGDITVSNVISSINVNENAAGTEYNFGEQGATISGTVFVDDNRDGTRQVGESVGVDSVRIELFASDGTTLLDFTTTDSSGNYEFIDLAAGDYVVKEIHPNRYTSTSSDTISVNLPTTGISDQNFGEALFDIGNYIWFDENGDGVQDGDEQGIGGVTVELIYDGGDGDFTNGNEVVSNTTTNASGSYQFTEQFNGNYRVVVNGGVPSGTIATSETDDSSVAVDGTSHIVISGTDRFDVDYGFTGTGTIGDRVFFDGDGDGLQDAGEPGFENITVNLVYAGVDNVFGNDDDLQFSKVTGTNGIYSFARMPGGDFRINVDTSDTDLPGGLTATSGAESHSGLVNVSLADGATNNTLDFGFTGNRTVGDTVFFDIDGDGTQDGDEPGIIGVVVQIAIDIDGDTIADYTASTTTDQSGQYSFDKVPDGTHTITIVTPNGGTPTTDHDGSAGGDAASTFTISGTNDLTQDFGVIGTGSIGDTIYWDINRNGAQDAGEAGLFNVPVQLEIDFNSDGTPDHTLNTTTDNTGHYLFENLLAGTYTLTVTPLTDTIQSDDPDSTLDHSSVVTLTAGQDKLDQTYGYYGQSTLGDLVFWDVNNNNVFDAGVDQGIENVDVTLTIDFDGDSTIDYTQTVQTDSDGEYLFENLVAGTYAITVTPASLPGSIAANPTTDGDGTGTAHVSTIVLGSIETDRDQDFGYTGTARVADLVFWDANNNGVFDAATEAGLPNVPVQLEVDIDGDGSYDYTLNTTTDADGLYEFVNLPASTYRVTVTPIAGTSPTADPDGTLDHVTVFSLTAGQDKSDVDFGYRGNSSIAERVFFDYVGDGGVYNAIENDRGMSGVDVTLSIDVNGDTTVDYTITTTTDSNGLYSFNHLIAGDYTIVVNSTDLPDQMGANPTYNVDSTVDNTTVVTLPIDTSNTTTNFGYHATPDYNIVIDDGNDNVVTGQSFNYTVTVRNDGTLRGNNAVVTVAFPNDILENVAATTGGIVDATAGTVTWNSTTTPALAVMNVGEEVTLNITADVVEILNGNNQPIVLTSNVTDDLFNGIDPVLTNNTEPDLDQIADIQSLKNVTNVVANGDHWDVSFELTVINTGSVQLDQLTLLDNLASQFGSAYVSVTTPVVDATAIATGIAPTVNPLWATDTSLDMLDPTNTSEFFAAGESYTVTYTVTLDPDASGTSFTIDNTATAGGIDISTVPGTPLAVTDDSDSGASATTTNPGAPGDTGSEDDSTPIYIPDVSIAKIQTGAVQDSISHNYTVGFRLYVENIGTVTLDQLSVVDSIAAQFGNAFVGIEAGSLTLTAAIGTGTFPVVNPGWETDTTASMIDATGASLDAGDSFILNFNVIVDPDGIDGLSQEVTNQATVSGRGLDENGNPLLDSGSNPIITTDLSDSGANANSNNLNEPGDSTGSDDPTPVVIPEIGVAKRLVSSVASTTAGNRDLTYELVVRNLGTVDLFDLSLLEDLDAQFGTAFKGVISNPVLFDSTASTDPTLSTWDGNAAVDMFDGVSGTLRPGEEFKIRFTVEVDIDALSASSNNQVTASGDWDVQPGVVGINGTVSDLSDTGTDPAGNNPGNPGDTGGFDDPTLVPAIGIAKDHGDYSEAVDLDGNPTGVFTVPTVLMIENLGATDLTNLNLRDDIATHFGDKFVSVENLAVVATGVTGTAPTANAAWMDDTTLNMLSGGSLRPGDSFTVTFDVTINPDAGDESGYLNNQAVITGSDPSNPTAVVQDFSDSGPDPSVNNVGEPGDTAGADDPTPISIPDIGLAKRIVNVNQKGLTFELTIELNLENIGTVDLNDIELFDDIATEYGANFGRIVATPVIVGSTATATPTLNAGYASDTSQAIFDGTDGFFKPGESLTLRIVVEVVPENGQTEVTVINQATTSGNPLDENGNPLRDDSNSLIGRIYDLSDSGAVATGSNPGAAGDTGSWDDPTPQPLTFFTFDAFNDPSQGQKGLEQDFREDSSNPFNNRASVNPDDYRSRGMLTHQISRLAPEPIFSGSARPGTQIFGRVYDSAGRLIGEELSMADVGGNWMMQFHHLGSQDHARIEFTELPGSSGAFDARGDVYGYLGMDSLNNDYASLEPWTFYDQSHEFTATYRPTVQQSLLGEHQKATRPLGLGR
ncbi:Serine-aspartate repeat-containing protein D precursor [Rubripirellula amarantea]|uniref:Serine-aspartate repeat-containing protein D n=1 Tax=Rubripirellula amarantea TaxID=2527999 RepID=A0A5C5WK61_9BACT|nr:SdrD B-like domain-containing protein [Rubripirellula amarantea]TWT50242.1 Serine-aspartate repeat-containing protein D precursor [Rubripirellula amarantea]